MVHVVANPKATEEFKIAVTYEVYGYIKVQANSREEALDWAEQNIDELPLPDEPNYIEGSYEIDCDFED